MPSSEDWRERLLNERMVSEDGSRVNPRVDPLGVPATFIPGLNDATHVRLSDRFVDRFIVCGLGSLGQQCILNLKRFDALPFTVEITAIDRQVPRDWETEGLAGILHDGVIVGDCRREELLRRAGIEQARAILVVTSDESTNVETAIAARRLNPKIQIVVRSSREGLNELLKRQLGAFVALNASDLAAQPFALAGLDQEICSIFQIGSHQFQVIEQTVVAGDSRFGDQPLHQLHGKRYRLLDLYPLVVPHQPLGWATTASSMFHRWQPHVRVQQGDRVVYVQAVDPLGRRTEGRRGEGWGLGWLRGDAGDGDQWVFSLWQWAEERQMLRLTAIALGTALGLWALGTVMLSTVSGISWGRAAFLGAILLLGGVGDVFGGLEEVTVPWWMQLTGLGITVTSLIVVLGVLGLLADRLLSSRFALLQRRPRIPRANHVIVVGLGRVGREIINVLQTLKHPFVVLTTQLEQPDLVTQMPILSGDILANLPRANLAQAKSVIAVTGDPMLNLEVALLGSEAHTQERTFRPVVRTYSQTFSDNLGALLPNAKALCAYALAAEAFAGAAMGENIVGLFQLKDQTILITEYHIELGDTLVGKLLAEVAYGYGVVPILLEPPLDQGARKSLLMPPDEYRLGAGDRLWVLSSINGLRRIERGERTPARRWRLEGEHLLNPEFGLDVGNVLVNLGNCELAEARQFVEHLPGTLELDLYDYQAHRLLQLLYRQMALRLAPVG